jgi:hypothetical protein
MNLTSYKHKQVSVLDQNSPIRVPNNTSSPADPLWMLKKRLPRGYLVRGAKTVSRLWMKVKEYSQSEEGWDYFLDICTFLMQVADLSNLSSTLKTSSCFWSF